MDIKEMKERGRPLLFNSVEELQDKIDQYFLMCDKEHKPYTLSGLAVYLDVDRRTLLNYENKDDFFPTLKKAKARIETFAEEQLYKINGQVAGVIFNLKNNFSWEDRQDLTHRFKEDKLKKINEFFDGTTENI